MSLKLCHLCTLCWASPRANYSSVCLDACVILAWDDNFRCVWLKSMRQLIAPLGLQKKGQQISGKNNWEGSGLRRQKLGAYESNSWRLILNSGNLKRGVDSRDSAPYTPHQDLPTSLFFYRYTCIVKRHQLRGHFARYLIMYRPPKYTTCVLLSVV